MLRFHITSGARLSLRGAAPLVGGIVLTLGLSPDPGATLEAVARHLTTLKHPGSPALALALILCTGLAMFAEKHLVPGVHGWLRSLPVSSRSHSRSFLLALIASQAPLLGGWLLLWLFGSTSNMDVSWLRLFSIPLTGVAAALLAVPCERRLLHLGFAIPGALLCVGSTWPGLLFGAVLLGAAAMAGGGISAQSRSRASWRRHGEGVSATFLPLFINWRALGYRWTGGFVRGLFPLLALHMFIRNNPLPASLLDGAGRLAAGLSAAWVTLYLVGLLAVRRPPWPWLRSQPQKAGKRVALDALFLFGHIFPLLAGAWILAPLSPGSVLTLILLATLLAIRGASALRQRDDSPLGSVGPILFESLFLAAWTGVTPYAAVVWLVLIPLAWRTAVRGEQNAGVYRWIERHHRAAGDSMSWSDQ